MRELCFDRAPNPEVRFRGNTVRNSVWGSGRENLPDEVREGVVYRNAGVRLRIASEVVDGDPGFKSNLNIGRVKTGSEYSERTNGKQKTRGKEEKE
jgi:hypothetical protein